MPGLSNETEQKELTFNIFELQLEIQLLLPAGGGERRNKLAHFKQKVRVSQASQRTGWLVGHNSSFYKGTEKRSETLAQQLSNKSLYTFVDSFAI